MFCKVRNYQLLPDGTNPGKPIKVHKSIPQIIYDQDMYFPVNYQSTVLFDIQNVFNKYKQPADREKAINELIVIWKHTIRLAPFKPLFQKKNLGILIGDPFYKYY